MNKTHEGRVAVVTGASHGIGRAIAMKLSQRGARVVLVDINDCDECASACDGETITVRADVSKDAGWGEIVRAVDDAYGRLDIVVNNAGIYPIAPIDELDEATWRRTMAVNLDAHFFSAKHCVPMMRRNGWGRFVNVSSNSIGVSQIGLSHYMASKMGVIGFVRGLANDVAADGITVNAVLPSITNTPGTSGVPDEFKCAVWELQAIRRFAEPDDIAGPVVFLTSDDAAFVTGQSLVADGGMYKIS